MQHKPIPAPHVVNQAGKVCQDEVAPIRRANPLAAALMRVLNGFGNLVSPIKEKKSRKVR